MPFRFRDSDKYQWLTAGDDVPLAPAVSIGQAVYVICCPHCGHMHEIRSKLDTVGQQIVMKPRCLLIEFANSSGRGLGAWQTIYEAWRKAYPQAGQGEISAVYLGSVSTVHSVAIAMKRLAKYAAPVEQEVKAAA